jgi:EAL domain-containing protein (putative c-di-GMP-specific phosphodiesterase class I)
MVYRADYLFFVTILPKNWSLKTESAIFKNLQTAIALTQALRSRQIKISIDDFGTGYSSLSYLTQFPADTLKIDRAFIQAMTASPKDKEVVKAVIGLGHALDLDVLAEGIETLMQYQSLRQMGCLYGQGYYFSKPLTADQMMAYLRSPLMQSHG